MKVLTFLLLMFVGSAAWAQTTAEATAQQHYDYAQAAFDAGEYDRAILELERSWRLEERPETLALRVRVLESMGEARLALDIIEQNRDVLANTPDIYLVEERLREALREKDTVVEPPAQAQRSNLNTIGPILLGAAGVGLGVWSTVLLLPESCEQETPSGACKELNEPAVLPGVGLSVAAVGAVAGAIYWWVAGTPENPAPTTSQETP